MADLRWTKLIVLPAIVGILAIAAVSFADTTADAKTPADKKVSLQVTNSPVIDAIDALFSQAGYKYTIEPGVSGNITLGLKGVTFSEALKALADGANLNVQTKDGRYIISPKPKPVVVATPSESTAPAVPRDRAPRAGVDDTTVNVVVPDPGPVFYGSQNPAVLPVIPVGGGSIYALPGNDWIYVVEEGGSPFGREPSPVFRSPHLNSPDWQRFKEELSNLRMDTGRGW